MKYTMNYHLPHNGKEKKEKSDKAVR